MRSKVDQQLGALAAVLSRRYRTEVDFLDSVHLRKAHDKGKLAKKIGPVALKKLDKISDEVFKKHNYLALSECVASTICGDIGF
ncbi:MAG: hypothetical protein KGD64_15530, partial [Candidatus Heimdallarchaeota archaeon]|nr:hypothetical protein [Candidatus Heimdallarchaeota archaeon]